MQTDEFLRRHPRLYHLAHRDALPSLLEHGLLSARELVRRSDADDETATALLRERRPESVALTLAGFPSVVLRDQKPLDLARLAPHLTGGMTVDGWLQLLGSYVFLFPNEETLTALRAAYDAEPVLVLELDSRSLVAEYGSLVRLSSINTGATIRMPAKRGPDTFRGIEQFDARRRVKEVAVEHGISDLRRHVRRAETWAPDGTRTPA